MKKALIFIFAVLLFVGCKDDSSDSPAPATGSPDNVEGNWQYQSVEQKNGVIKLNGFAIASFYTESKDVEGNLFLKASGRFDSFLEYAQTTFVTDNQGNTSKTEQKVPALTINGGSYTHNKATNSLTIDDGSGETEKFTITEHTDSKLVLESTYETVVNNQGAEQIVSATVVSTLTK